MNFPARLPLLMGIINITPDSFFAESREEELAAVLAKADGMQRDGADIVDIGAQSTRPGFTPLSVPEEWKRLETILSPLVAAGHFISLDSSKPDIIRRALRCGVQMINDQQGLQGDPRMAQVLAEGGGDGQQPRVVVMYPGSHFETALARMRPAPERASRSAEELWDHIRRFFDKTLEIARYAELDVSRLTLDPGIGFKRTLEENLLSIRLIPRLKRHYGLPVLLGASRKSFLGQITGEEPDGRLAGTLGANLFGALEGAAILRVHDIKPHRDMLEIFRALAQTSV